MMTLKTATTTSTRVTIVVPIEPRVGKGMGYVSVQKHEDVNPELSDG